MEQVTDNELMRRVADGDSAAFEELVRRFQEPLQRFLWSMLNSPEEAHDAAQDVFLQAYRNRARYDPRQSFKTWIFTIARNRGISVLRKRKGAPLLVSQAPEDESGETADILGSVPDAAPGPRQLLSAVEDAAWLRRALDRLDEPHRLVLEMKYLGGMKSRDIADTLGLEVGTVWSRVHHGLKKLKALASEMSYER